MMIKLITDQDRYVYINSNLITAINTIGGLRYKSEIHFDADNCWNIKQNPEEIMRIIQEGKDK